ncbi:hypothetical protein LTR37_005801 [Vermiconidia calcicola]|uniref:Uncharacterized protein n=1 Tax=Vermiconidia calcicola TaxID=1690605 RepID=A0ACC3NIE0_9PEZI|nr:hypothetical protein LTR37_005801 [Vermiconidia calcicola]
MYLTRWTSALGSGNSELLDYHYGPLNSVKTGIRLARIQPGTGNKGIAINLVDSFVTGGSKIAYDALSYTWGAGARNKTITCNGKRLLITQALLEALQRFRNSDRQVTLWIDQICICQDRVKERNQQVQLMGKIFKGAQRVIVWLGPDYDDSRAGVQLAKQLLSLSRYQPVSGLTPADLDAHGLPRQGHRRWHALSAVLRRPWFWRTWTIQEAVLNPNVELVIGASSFTWGELESIVALLEGPMPRTWQLDQAISASELPFSRINRIRLRHQRLIRTPITPISVDARFADELYAEPEPINLDDDEHDDPQLLDLLLMSRGLGATDPRDKIYALLGLGKHDIDPDYSMSPECVFTDFALQTIGAVTNRPKVNSLDMDANLREVRRALILISCAGKHNQQLPSLPSWVPDWTVDLSSRPLVFGLGQRFAAGGDKLGSFDWDFGLQLCGKLLDSITVAGLVHLDYSLDKHNGGPHAVVQEWWQEAQQIAFTRIARSPGSTMNMDAFEAMRRDLSLCRHGYYMTPSQKLRRNSLLEELDTSDQVSHSASQTMTLGPTRGRVFFTSSTGYIGIAPYGTREGDLIFVVLGADVPFVLRPLEDGYCLIGEAYVQGAMNGEVLLLEHLPVQDIMIS